MKTKGIAIQYAFTLFLYFLGGCLLTIAALLSFLLYFYLPKILAKGSGGAALLRNAGRKTAAWFKTRSRAQARSDPGSFDEFMGEVHREIASRCKKRLADESGKLKDVEKRISKSLARHRFGSIAALLFIAALVFFYLEGRNKILGIPISFFLLIMVFFLIIYLAISKYNIHWRDEL